MSQSFLSKTRVKTVVANGTVTGATNATPIVCTSTAHGLATGDMIRMTGITGNTAANGDFVVTRVDANSYSLDNSKGNGTFGGTGTAVHIGFAEGILADNTVFTNGVPQWSVHSRIEALSAGATLRSVVFDSADSAYVTEQAVAVFVTTAGSKAVSNENSIEHTTNYPAVPDMRIASAGNYVRAKHYITGGVGKSATFTVWIAY